MKNADIAEIFNKIAALLEIKGENQFRVRAYRRAALQIESLGKDIASMNQAELLDVPGIGKDLAAKIGEYLETGRIEVYEKLRLDTPESLLTLLSVPGLGPKTVGMLFEKQHVRDIGELEQLARAHKLLNLPGIREKTEANIIRGIDMLKRETSRFPLGRMLPLASEIVRHLSEKSPADRLSIAGSIRRWKETIRDIDIIATSKNPRAVMKVFAGLPDVAEVLLKGTAKSTVLLKSGVQVDIRVVGEDSYGAAMAYFTGSREHNIRLRELASKAGFKLNEYGIFREKDGKKLGGSAEEDIYSILGLQYVPPELREDMGEIEAAGRGELPHLLEPGDLRGDLHMHSNWTDGSLQLEDLAALLKERGYEYIAVTDHSKGLGIAHGLNEEKILEQKKVIDGLNRKTRGFRLLAGVEVNIKSNGGLDLDEEVLRQLDIVVASVHSGFRQSRERITRRIVAAMKNPYVSVIGHPTGRLIGERDAYDADMQQILRTAAETGTALEINAYPLRLDLSEPHVRSAKALGVPLVISTDAHTPVQFGNMVFGVSLARRSWLEKKDVLNTLDCRTLLKKLKGKKSRTLP